MSTKDILQAAAGVGGGGGFLLYGWGRNETGQLDTGDLISRSSPVQVGAEDLWLDAGARGGPLLAIKATDGSLWYFDTSGPVQIGTETGYASISVHSTVMLLKENGERWGYGSNFSGQLGDGTRVNQFSSPVLLDSGGNWQSVIASQDWCLGVKTNGTLWSWGYNGQGQLGLNDRVDRSSPVQVGALSNWSQVAVSNNAGIAVKTDGTMWAWGWNTAGELGQGNRLARSSPVQVGALTTWAYVAMVAGASDAASLAVKTDGTLWGWGRAPIAPVSNISSPAQIGSATNWARVYGGANSGAIVAQAIKTDGTLWSWGENDYGRVGDNSITTKTSPVQIGSLTNWVKGFPAGQTSGALAE